MLIIYSSDMREPYMGNTIPVKVAVHVEEGEVTKVVLISPEDIEYPMTEERRFMMKPLGED